MNVTKRVFVSVLVFGMFCLFTSGALAIDVLYAPLEDFNNGKTTVYVGPGTGSPELCTFTSGITPVSGKVGMALPFNGSRYITVPNNNSPNFGKDDFAITFWVKTKSGKRNNTIIDKRKAHESPGYSVTLYNGRPLLHMCQYPGGPTNWSNYWGGMGSTAVNDGKWHYVAIYVERNNPNGGKIYVDEMCVHTFDPSYRNGSLDNDAPLLIGKHVEWNHAHFEGALDELRIFRGSSKR